ncbi:MAP3K12-binding inhibitory protein 1-like isoform X2 [Limulus polyphemus]|uniref:MAP3K12-binding inhibitory protein 1-like isoform X2 n=1 Tax=Limulus polyphemus TaxID=6850 RepID=A0ABM1SLY4_LIMPO|nr:MAP3K12-binding inhibitory protein 1-like isoform X2 [Limulus polyphemus]
MVELLRGVFDSFCLLLSIGKEKKIIEDFTMQYKLSYNLETSVLIELLKPLQKLHTEITKLQDSIAVSPIPQMEARKVDEDNAELIQIKLERRITAFISRKRKEVDEWNLREFCNHALEEEYNQSWEDGERTTCARVDAPLIPRSVGKNRVKVSRVDNKWGPQTQLHHQVIDNKRQESSEHIVYQDSDMPESVEERLRNLESHLKLKAGQPVSQDVYRRLKVLEDKILFLEGLSPSYMSVVPSVHSEGNSKNKTEVERKYENWKMSDIEKRIFILQETLRRKTEK